MKQAWLPGLVLLAMAGTGCADTEIQGVVLDEDLNTVPLMLPLARGVNSEFADVYLASQIQWLHDGSTDAILNDGTTSAEEDYAIADYRERIHSSAWAQLHETVWAVFYADNRMREVLSAEDYATSNLLSRIYVYGGHAERMLGEMYCDLVYNYGKDGGVLLGDQSIYDAGNLVPNDSAFKRAIWMYERALELAEAGVSAGVTAPADETPGRPIFEADHLVTASHAGLAQAYANLGDWNNAVQHARMVPDGWADWSLMDSEVDGGNDMADFFFENDDMNMYRTPIAMKWFDDPRAQIVKCGDWAGPNLDDSPSTPPASAFINMSAACGVISGEYRSESNRYPLWITTKYEDDSADIEVASGAEMRLIEAEAALVQGNLGEFTAQVNRARAVYGATPISQPATAGAIEFPNAEDDAWSILDRERLLELFGEARRAWDLRRWEHPFVTDNHVLVPRHVEELGPQGRFICIPVPDQECDTNPLIDCPNLASG
jgi:hypothetical protein